MRMRLDHAIDLALALPRLAARLQAGDRLVHDVQAGRWSLLSTGEPIPLLRAELLLGDRKLGLAPCGDQLPGFPPSCSQTWSCPPRRRRRIIPGRSSAAAAQHAAPP